MFSTECKKYVCPNMTHILSAYPDNRIMCIENGKTITQKRILQAELIGQIFNSEPKLQFGLENNNLSKNIETKQHVSAKPYNQQLQEDQHSSIQTRIKHSLDDNSLSKNTETKQLVSAKPYNQQLQEDQHSSIQTRIKHSLDDNSLDDNSKLQFGLENNNLSKNIETKQHVSAKTCNWQLQEDQHSPILTRTKIIKKSKLSSKLSLSDYQLKEYHYFETPVVKLELESYPIKSLSISHILSNFYQ